MNFSLLERIANRLIINSPLVPSLGLMNGKTGDAICFYRLYRKTGNKIYEEVADSLIDLISEEINSGITPGFYLGLSGIGCGMEYLIRENFMEPAANDVLEEIDEAVFQLDRKKYKPSCDVTDFYGPGLYYLMRTGKGNTPCWNDEAIKFLTYDLRAIIENPVRDAEISNDYLVSLILFISKTKHLFPAELSEAVTAFAGKNLNRKSLDIVEKRLLSVLPKQAGFSTAVEHVQDLAAEIEKTDERDFLKACTSFSCYGLFFPDIVAELKTFMETGLNTVAETETFQKLLLDSDFGLAGAAKLIDILPHDGESKQNIPLCFENKKSLYIFNETSRAAVYGIGTYVNELASCLKNIDDINLNVVSLNDEGKEFCPEEKDGVKHWNIPACKHRSNDYEKQQKLYYKGVVTLLKQYVPHTENMTVHLNYLQNLPLLENLKATFDCRAVVAIHYMNWAFGLQGNVSRLKAILEKNETELDDFEKNIRKSFKSEQTLFNRANAVICLARHTYNILCGEYKIAPDKIATIYNGLRDGYHPLTLAEKKNLKLKYHLDPNGRLILFAGRLDPIKGVDILINSFKKILEQKPKSRLIIAGEGDFGKYFKTGENFWTKITFTGRIAREKLFELYSIADIGVMPSTHEQCSYTAIEMMMHGLPLIATTTTGLAEMVEDGVSGLHVPVEEYEDRVEISEDLLTEKILYLLNNPAILKEMKTQSRKRYQALYGSEVMKRNMMEFYG